MTKRGLNTAQILGKVASLQDASALGVQPLMGNIQVNDRLLSFRLGAKLLVIRLSPLTRPTVNGTSLI